MAVGEVKTKRWTRPEYYRLAEVGLLQGKRAELIEGEIYTLSPQGPQHSMAVSLVLTALQTALANGVHVRVQSPLALGLLSEPEPDLSVVVGTPRDYPEHPTAALLVVEVSDSTLQYDRLTKTRLYAQAGIPEYWLLDLVHRQLEVRREPTEKGYLELQTYQPQQQVSPLAAPGASISVASILP